MVQFFHPAREDISLTAVLSALGEPARMGIIRKLWVSETGQNCGAAALSGYAALHPVQPYADPA